MHVIGEAARKYRQRDALVVDWNIVEPNVKNGMLVAPHINRRNLILSQRLEVPQVGLRYKNGHGASRQRRSI